MTQKLAIEVTAYSSSLMNSADQDHHHQRGRPASPPISPGGTLVRVKMMHVDDVRGNTNGLPNAKMLYIHKDGETETVMPMLPLTEGSSEPQNSKKYRAREQWANKAEFVLACMAYAIGLGNGTNMNERSTTTILTDSRLFANYYI